MDGLENIITIEIEDNIEREDVDCSNNTCGELYKKHMSEWKNIGYEELINDDDDDNYYYIDEIDYEQMTKKELKHIMKYYKLNIGRKTKQDYINEIMLYEMDAENIIYVEQRKRLWEYIEELKIDEYLSKFISI